MSQLVHVAVAGAASATGEALVEIAEERGLPIGELHLIDEGDSIGQSLAYKGRNLRIRDAAQFDFGQVGLVFFAGDAAQLDRYVEPARLAGCAVIDVTSGKSATALPRIVPELNARRLASLDKPVCVGSPAPEATALAVVLAPLLDLLSFERITVTACVPVSSRGRRGVNELARQTAELLNARPLEPRLFGQQVAFNLLGADDTPEADGHTLLEKRLANELKQLLDMPLLPIAVSCILAPVFFGSSLSVSLRSTDEIDLDAVARALGQAPGLELASDDEQPSVVGDAIGQDVVHVGRVRHGLDDRREVNLWIVSDNVRKGAALNAVQTGELLIKHYL
ncbi:aspartate-semialdehyde dehydrogenase [Stutzerimonas nosocomialis]|uniref:Aspartate-semialdehyde dehydrogenase n=1 Tax=Stutzerimonas nosocomialis TaxID=1056496 RepID=A0A5R9QJY2_9GAMM|nr:aspartate-semialdehyde dehydrogenase [Stutzerimonas nosocomialis]TLX65263.1 aspartate-semialdehyde dehydrogenase [Stutzerimonas nosocomialis]